MSNTIDITIERIYEYNYHKFNDMVSWRINGVERSSTEKEQSPNTAFKEACGELSHQGFYVFAAEYKGRFIGWITLMYTPKIGAWEKGVIYVDELWTAPEFRRRGVARKLMEKAFEIQSEIGAVKVRLYTSNIAAQKLYEKCGLLAKGSAIFMES
ncbi:GNAT family N-acetyltransferase [Wukongibacter baidiensis]|uniref:GNAT family N-acetyltransferase n=1 Tax=Wukongibacter baidiensis TaxID=1723361 RepID=UPI003D7F8C62